MARAAAPAGAVAAPPARPAHDALDYFFVIGAGVARALLAQALLHCTGVPSAAHAEDAARYIVLAALCCSALDRSTLITGIFDLSGLVAFGDAYDHVFVPLLHEYADPVVAYVKPFCLAVSACFLWIASRELRGLPALFPCWAAA